MDEKSEVVWEKDEGREMGRREGVDGKKGRSGWEEGKDWKGKLAEGEEDSGRKRNVV